MKPFASSLVLLLVVASSAHADNPGINLAWNDCLGTASAADNVNYACDGSRNGQPFRAVFSFVQPVSCDAFVGVEATMDITAETPTLPDWWTVAAGFNGSGGPNCREGNFNYPESFIGVGGASCQNPWANAYTGGGWAFWYQTTQGGPPRPGYGRIKFTFARDTATHLDAGSQYIGGVFTIDTWKDVDTGSGVCAGCSLPTCLFLSEIDVTQESGAPPSDIFVLTNASTRQYITWQGGFIVGCNAAVPVRRSTWGSIKATYR